VEIIEQQEGIEQRYFALSEDPLEVHSGTFENWLALYYLPYLSHFFHDDPPWTPTHTAHSASIQHKTAVAVDTGRTLPS
jgi:hypothetical protein